MVSLMAKLPPSLRHAPVDPCMSQPMPIGACLLATTHNRSQATAP